MNSQGYYSEFLATVRQETEEETTEIDRQTQIFCSGLNFEIERFKRLRPIVRLIVFGIATQNPDDDFQVAVFDGEISFYQYIDVAEVQQIQAYFDRKQQNLSQRFDHTKYGDTYDIDSLEYFRNHSEELFDTDETQNTDWISGDDTQVAIEFSSGRSLVEILSGIRRQQENLEQDYLDTLEGIYIREVELDNRRNIERDNGYQIALFQELFNLIQEFPALNEHEFLIGGVWVYIANICIVARVVGFRDFGDPFYFEILIRVRSAINRPVDVYEDYLPELVERIPNIHGDFDDFPELEEDTNTELIQFSLAEPIQPLHYKTNRGYNFYKD